MQYHLIGYNLVILKLKVQQETVLITGASAIHGKALRNRQLSKGEVNMNTTTNISNNARPIKTSRIAVALSTDGLERLII